MTTPVADTELVLQVRGVTKSFGANEVLRGVGLGIRRGSIYGLMGANGAGKSTLIKILCGAEQPDAGQILLGGEPVTFADPLAAVRSGVGTVHQNPNDGVVLDMTVAENLALDRLNDRGSGRWFTLRRAEQQAAEVADVLGLQLSRAVMRSPVHTLGVSDRQLLVLARALSRRPEVLILDEPTSALSTDESGRLFDLLRQQVADGTTLLYVSHKLAEFDLLCDQVGVLRDGAMQGQFERVEQQAATGTGFDWAKVLQALFDRSPGEMQRTERTGSDAVLTMSGVQVVADAQPFDLELRRGEVTVLLGLLGSGKSELLEWIFGARPAFSGTLTLDGEPFSPRHPADAVDAGVYLVPESRHEQAIVPSWSVQRQMSLPFTRQFSNASMMNSRRERSAAGRMIQGLGVVARSPGSPIETLSGGNQQKAMIGRWLLGEPRVLLLDEPFRGVDINARHDIGDTVRALTDRAAVLVATSDLDEAIEVADRIVVLRQGTVASDVRLADASRHELISTMSVRGSGMIEPTGSGHAVEVDDPLERAGIVPDITTTAATVDAVKETS